MVAFSGWQWHRLRQTGALRYSGSKTCSVRDLLVIPHTLNVRKHPANTPSPTPARALKIVSTNFRSWTLWTSSSRAEAGAPTAKHSSNR